MEYNAKTTKKTVPKLEDGQVGIRATLNNMGFSDSQIGYDEGTGTVTLDGKMLMKPGYMDEDAGVSYANEKDIRRNVVDLFQGTSNPVVRVSDAYSTFAGKYGLSADALTYGSGEVLIGGSPLDILYIDEEGKSWARQNTVENAVANYAGSVGVQTPTALAEQYANEYLEQANYLARDLYHTNKFSYNPEEDPVFQAYQTQYLREGARASQNAMADYAALTGGYGNSAAATAGAQARQYYGQKISDVIPELAQNAFQQYIQKYQSDISLLGQLTNLYNTAYDNAEKANQAQRNNVNATAQSNIERNQTAWEMDWQEKERQQDYLLDEQAYVLGEQSYRKGEQEMQHAEELHPLQMQAMNLSEQEQRIFLQYYDKILKAELAGKQLDNQKKQKDLYK